eukprot:m.4462 g.4462  ORF g.4462 m.4462 type:complete len:659 (-) comp4321_c0_seq2:32-2008(-)
MSMISIVSLGIFHISQRINEHLARNKLELLARHVKLDFAVGPWINIGMLYRRHFRFSSVSFLAYCVGPLHSLPSFLGTMEENAAQAPSKFRFYENGEELMLMPDALRFHNTQATTLLEEFPSLYRRQASQPERGVLGSAGLSRAPLITLVKSSEMNAIFAKDQAEMERLKAAPGPLSLSVNGRLCWKQSNSVPTQPMNPVTNVIPPRARNPLAPYYRYADGLASPSDSMPEVLAPIRLSIENEGVRYRDQFTWNVNDATLKPSVFADTLVQDAELPVSFAPLITAAIEAQLEEFVTLQEISGVTRHVTINIEIQMGDRVLKDRFLWDPSEPRNCPEDFARVLALDLGLGGTLVPIIAHAIREQLFLDRKTLLAEDNPNVIENSDLPSGPGDLFRNATNEAWAPSWTVLASMEREKRQLEEERESRWRRRAARESLPDKGGRGRGRGAAKRAESRRRSVRDDMREAFQASLVNLPAAPVLEIHEPAALSFVRPRNGPTLPSVVRPVPATEDELILASHPSTALSRSGRTLAATAVPLGYERTVPRLGGAAGSGSTLVPLGAVNPSPGYAGRVQFTPQVVLHLKKWLYDHMVADPSKGIPHLSDEEKTELASALNLTVRQIAQWFQNRRKDYAQAVRAHHDYVNMLHEQINAGAASQPRE